MKPLRTRNDIFAAINCRMVEIEEGNPKPDEEIIDYAITAGAYIIRAIEGIIRHNENPALNKARKPPTLSPEEASELEAEEKKP